MLKRNKGKIISDEEVMGTKMNQQNLQWIQEVKRQGNNILDLRGDGYATFYNIENEVIFGPPKK
jgi:hypothetical protein